ncbi:MAG: cytochrome c [Sphingomonadales bacterium]|nr:cytochrome c [Sphingomonadales bacterium]
MNARLALLGAMLALVAAGGRAATESPAAGTAQGVYSAAQADAGAQVYAGRCAVCHGADLSGTWEIPALRGRFVGNWGRTPLAKLYDYLGHAMPQFAPGTLEPPDNVAVIAFLLRENGAPAGGRPLPADRAALERIVLDPVTPH